MTSTGSHSRVEGDQSLEEARVTARGPEYPTIRPSGATSLADAPPAAAYGGTTTPVSSMPAGSAYGTTTPVSSMPAGSTYGAAAPVSSTPARATYGSTTPVSGSAAPASGMPSASGGAVAALSEQTSVVPPLSRLAAGGKPAERVYRTRGPLAAAVIAVVTVVLLVPAGLLLVQATFVDDPAARGIVPAVLLILGLPLTGAGLYAMAGGIPAGRDPWLRPPLAYLPVGLVLLLAAGLAVA